MKFRSLPIQFFLAVFLFATGPFLSGQVQIWEGSVTLPTYEPKPPDKNPMFYVPDAYQGAKRVLYPYPLMDNLSENRTEMQHKALFLENEYIKLCLLPDIGGRLFYATDKSNDYEIFYRQHVIKPANIGMLGAWISGGIEWCVFHHHRASTYLPVDYRLVENEDGSKTIWIGETEPRHRMKWSIGISLHPGRSTVEAEVRMYNRTEHTHSILYWANVATHVNDHYQVFFPPSVEQGVYHAKNSFINWPISDEVYNGKDYRGQIDVSWWKNHPDPISIFAHDLQEDFMGGYDHSRDAGTIHVGNHHIVKGAKLWEWGPGPYGHMWDCEILTDDDGPYAELMVGGYSDNQPDYSWIKPGEVKILKQTWYPARDLGGIKNANLDAAVNIELDDQNRVRIGLNATHLIEDGSVILLKDQEVLFKEKVSIGPANPYSNAIEVGADPRIARLKVLFLDSDKKEVISYQEEERGSKDELPETVKPPGNPDDIAQIEELVLTGQRIMQFHNPGYSPESYFIEALQRDPGHSLANLHLGNLSSMRGKYEEAAIFYRKSIQRITRDYTRPRDCEALYRLGAVLKKMKKYEDAVDTLWRATWDQSFYAAAHFELAGISALKGDYREAVQHLNRSQSMNGLNPEVYGLKSAIYRQLGENDLAVLQAHGAREIDPLDYMAAYELLLMNELDPVEFSRLLNEQRENYLELATEYMSFGLLKEALGVLETAISSPDSVLSSYPILHYYCAYINEKLGEPALANLFYQSGSNASTDYVFPFRFETLEILDAAIKHNPGDAKAWYYKGNILYDHQPADAMNCWNQAIQFDDGLAIAHRNLGWGCFRHLGAPDKAINRYEKAISLYPGDPRYYYELDLLYEKQNEPLEKRLNLLTSNHPAVSLRNDAFLREIEVLLLNGMYEPAIGYLSAHLFQRQEGVVNLHDLFVNAHLLQGRELMLEGQYEEALDHFLKADSYPENHMIGRISAYAKEAQIFYYTAMAFKGLKRKSKADRYFNKASEIQTGSSEYLYYQCLAARELNDQHQADVLGERLMKAGQASLDAADQADFFAKFGEGRNANERKAAAYYKLALAYHGSNQPEKAKKTLEQAVQLKNSILWANAYWDSF